MTQNTMALKNLKEHKKGAFLKIANALVIENKKELSEPTPNKFDF